MKTRRSKATDISAKVKAIVWRRDGERCIFCGRTQAMPNAHYIPRSKGVLGIEQNIVTACITCHFEMDQTSYRHEYLERAKKHLQMKYPLWNEEDLYYRKGV